ncbi:hypothetical protein [Jatrophihabitans sp.]|uniref:hypothetical protein n=1 Tax=Jatrophihabitans sp. TaxID=1932789 RepID=UPI002B720FEA|nr:hypothetical protein [Jatrophihabitans sp.]
MHEIPKPELLDPDRLLLDDRNDLTADEHASRAALLNQALHESCGYAQQLWQSLDAVRGYLLDSLPPDPHALDPDALDQPGRRSAAPTGPDDEAGWENWITAYATVTSVLAGPHGDSGFGSDEARREARDRRQVLPEPPAAPEPVREPAPEAAGLAARRPDGHTAAGRSRLRLAARVAVLLLAIRGLRRGSR